MNKEQLFVQALQQIKDLGKDQGGQISEIQLSEIFAEYEFDMDDAQKELVFEYLKKSGIGIGEPINPEDYLSKEEVDYLKEYLDEVEQLEKLSDGQKDAVTISAMAGDRDAQNKLVEIYLPYVAEIAKLYAGQGVFLEDLIGEGNVALAMGVTMLDCLEKPSEVQGMLGSMMMDAMEEYIKENTNEQQHDKKLADKVNKIAELAREVAEDLGRKVTPAELAEEKGVSLKSVLEAVKLSGNRIEDIDMSEYNDDTEV